jgi:hypothetical protein
VIASEYSKDAGSGSFGYFSFALAGIPLVVGTVAVVILLGERLLPQRSARSLSKEFSDHARTLIEQYGLDDDDALLTRGAGLAEVVVPPRSPLVGDTAFPGMAAQGGGARLHGDDDQVAAVGDQRHEVTIFGPSRRNAQLVSSVERPELVVRPGARHGRIITLIASRSSIAR